MSVTLVQLYIKTKDNKNRYLSAWGEIMKSQAVTSAPPERLYLTRKHRRDIVDHCRSQAPLEACGLLSGRGSQVKTVHRMTNKDKSEEHYMMEPKEQFQVFKKLRETGGAVLGIYHSHPETEAYPSEEDKRLAFYPTTVYLIVSLTGEKPVFRGFIIDEKDNVSEVPVETT